MVMMMKGRKEEEKEQKQILLVPPKPWEGQLPLHLHRTLRKADGKQSWYMDSQPW